MSNSFKYEIIIKEHHLDSFGHVNNAIYLELYEEARWEYITLKGYGLAEVHRYQKGPVVLEAHLKFLKELKLRETIGITFEQIEEYGPSTRIFKMLQKMTKSNGELASELVITFGFFDLVERKLIKPTPEWLKVFS